MELRAVYVLVQFGLYFNRNATSVEARITIRMGTGHIFVWYTYGSACSVWTERHIFAASIMLTPAIERSSIF